MIIFDKLWKTLKAKGISQYDLEEKQEFSKSQLQRLRRNANITTHTLNMLCEILDCKLEDIAEYVPDTKPIEITASDIDTYFLGKAEK